MQVQDMIQRVRYDIGEASVTGQIGTQTGTWSDQQILGYINDGQALVARPARLQAPPVTINLQQGVTSYPLPSDCMEDGVRKLVWNTNGASFEVEDVGLDRWSELNDLQTAVNSLGITSAGAVYCQWAGSINLFPQSDNATDTLTVYYYRLPKALINVTDTPDIPQRFHIALVKYAIAQCQSAVEEAALSANAMAEFQRLLAQMEAERSVESRDMPARVRLRR